jgi:asparagine synthase (glutamine-hydrolysing)
VRERIPRAIRRTAGAIGALMPHGMRGRRFLRHLALEGPGRYFDASTMFHADEMRQLFRSEALAQIAQHDPWSTARGEWREPAGDWLAAAQYDDLNRYLPLDILTKVDRMTMAHSIEARPPLLDHKFVEFAATIPAKFRLNGRDTKYIFKKAMRGILPDSIIDRQKHGFAVPLARWFRGDLQGFARDVLLSPTCRDRGIFETRSVERLFQLHTRGRDLDLQLWTMLSFELWCQRFLDTVDVRDVAPARTRQTLRRPAPPAIVATA